MYGFALIGAAGFVAPRHLRAIHDTGNRLVAAVDPHDSVGVLDGYFPDARFFTEIERFDRHLEKLRRSSEEDGVSYVSICSPNFLHDAHVRLALRVRAHAICEKPMVINPWNLEAIEELEAESGCHAYTVLQLRKHPSVLALKDELKGREDRADVCLTYVTRRGPWYHYSWKGSEQKSGGLAMNIGIHFFDMLIWLFGAVETSSVHVSSLSKMAGAIELERARVRWFLSVDAEDLPAECRDNGRAAFRSITVDGQEIEFSEGFTDLHTRIYEDVLAGRGLRAVDARPSIELVHSIRTGEPVPARGDAHPMLGT
jgi:UDP-N-acetyl-2-amino-2-deoxyglucuronate dehydrogenase